MNSTTPNWWDKFLEWMGPIPVLSRIEKPKIEPLTLEVSIETPEPSPSAGWLDRHDQEVKDLEHVRNLVLRVLQEQGLTPHGEPLTVEDTTSDYERFIKACKWTPERWVQYRNDLRANASVRRLGPLYDPDDESDAAKLSRLNPKWGIADIDRVLHDKTLRSNPKPRRNRKLASKKPAAKPRKTQRKNK